MREALAGVLAGFQGLGGDDSRERPIDRLGALGFGAGGRRHVEEAAKGKRADREAALRAIGACLLRFKSANCPASRSDAEELLAIALRWPTREHPDGMNLKRRQLNAIARHAVTEWVLDFCPVCKGTKEVPDQNSRRDGPQPMKCCPADPVGCGGSGKRRYSDQERIEAMGEAHSKAMAEAHALISLAEGIAVRVAKEMLERW